MRLRLRWTFVSATLALFAGCAQSSAGRLKSPAAIAQQRAVLEEALSPRKRAEACLANAAKLEQDGFPRDAIDQYQRARALDASVPGAAHRLAVLLDREGEFERAAPEYAAALAERPLDAAVWNDYGYFLYQRSRFPEAEQALRRSLELDPSGEPAAGNLALVLAEQGRDGEALAVWEPLVGPAAARNNLGMILARRGRTEEAQTLLQQAVARDPSLRPARAALDIVSTEAAKPQLADRDPARIIR